MRYGTRVSSERGYLGFGSAETSVRQLLKAWSLHDFHRRGEFTGSLEGRMGLTARPSHKRLQVTSDRSRPGQGYGEGVVSSRREAWSGQGVKSSAANAATTSSSESCADSSSETREGGAFPQPGSQKTQPSECAPSAGALLPPKT